MYISSFIETPGQDIVLVNVIPNRHCARGRITERPTGLRVQRELRALLPAGSGSACKAPISGNAERDARDRQMRAIAAPSLKSA